MSGPSAGWIADDFADTPNQEGIEYDPWAVQSAYDELNSHSPSVDTDAEFAEPAFDHSELSDNDDDPLPLDSEASREWVTLLNWDQEQPGSGPALIAAKSLGTDESGGQSLDDPEPLAEFDSELGQPLYEPNDDTRGLPGQLRIDELLARIDETSDVQRQEITETLLEFSQQRLKKWLPWLQEKQWTGQSLLLFLQFAVYWDENPALWESSYWDARLGFWQPTSNHYNLTRDDQFALVNLRIDCSPAQVIDRTWFEDWEELALWKYGYQAFITFALFRAGLPNWVDWRDHVEWNQPIDLNESSMTFEDSQSNHSTSSQLHKGTSPATWFGSQDWYDPVEWHDGLGW